MAMSLESCISDACALATAHMKNPALLVRLWRYLNLIHVLAYTGVCEYYTKENLFLGFVQIYGPSARPLTTHLLACPPDRPPACPSPMFANDTAQRFVKAPRRAAS